MVAARSGFACLLVLTSACSARTYLDAPDGGGGAAKTSTGTGSTTSNSTTSTATIDPGVLAGHWMQQSIGNCINGEEWYSFGSSPGFVHTLVDRNFCGPHGVESDPGAAEIAPWSATLTWSLPGDVEHRAFTFAVIDPYPAPLPPPEYPGYVHGTRVLNVAAYRRTGDALVWHRDYLRGSDVSSGTYEASLSVDVALDAPLQFPGGTKACAMTITITASSAPATSGKPGSGTEEFDFPCTYGITQTSYFLRIIPDGFEPYGSEWYDVLKSKGIYDKYDSGVVSLFETEFRPILFFDPKDTSALFDDDGAAWFFEMESPPPDHVD